MKLAAGEVEKFVERPRPGVVLALLYGPDAGLVSARSKHLGTRIVLDLADPFRVTELDGDRLEGAGGRLIEEAQALCLTGGRRLVRVRSAGDGLTDACRALLALTEVAAFVLLEAGDLGPASSLRRLVEVGRQAVALPCYRAEAGSLRASIESQLKAHGLEPSREAMAWLIEHLGGDHALTRSEIDKLALYLADAPSSRVTLDDAAAILGDSSAMSIDEVVQAAVLGDLGPARPAPRPLPCRGCAPWPHPALNGLPPPASLAPAGRHGGWQVSRGGRGGGPAPASSSACATSTSGPCASGRPSG